MEGSRELRSLLLSTGSATRSSTPAFVRKLFRDLAGGTSLVAVSSAQEGRRTNTVGANNTASLCGTNANARSNCILLLRYCLRDLGAAPPRGARDSQGSRQGAARGGSGGSGWGLGGDYIELAGLPLVPLVDGSHGVFERRAVVDAGDMEMMKSMGFSEARSRQALAKHKEVAAAVDWLSSGGGGAKEAGGRPFVLCTGEEACLLAGAGASLVSEASLAIASSSSPSGGGSGQGEAEVQGSASTRAVDDEEDDGRVLRALRSRSLQSTLNVTGMRDDLLPDLIGQTLPVQWGGGDGGRGGRVSGVNSGILSETAFSWTPGRSGHPDVDWFRSLWGYLALTRPSAVRLLAESFPVVPTGEAAVCPLSLRSAVIDASGLGADVRSILVKAGCRTLLPGVFAGGIGDTAAADTAGAGAGAGADSVVTSATEGKEAAGHASEGQGQASTVVRRQLPPPPVELFEYVRSGTRRGVLAALGTAQRSAGKPLPELMRTASASERDALRSFLAREPANDLSDVEVVVCCGLPIVPLHEDGLVTALALAKAGPAAAAVAAAAASKVKQEAAKVSAVKPKGDASLTVTPPGGGTYTHAGGGPLYLLREGESGLIGVGGRGGDVATGKLIDPAAPPPPQLQWLETHLLTPRFVKGSGDSRAAHPGEAEAALLERLGAELVGRATFFVDHVFPRIGELPAGLRDAAMVEALLAAPRLSQQHQQFKGELMELEFIPVGGRVSLGLVVLVWRSMLFCICQASTWLDGVILTMAWGWGVQEL